MEQIAGELWINRSDSYSNFALLLLGGWAFLIGMGAGLELARRRGLAVSGRPGTFVIAAVLYGAIPAAALALAVGAVQSLVRAVV